VAQRSVVANGLTFACLEEGPAHGPLALCLHGFPDTAHTWRHLLPELAGAGFHAVAPFMRGYAPTDVPPDGRYQIGALVGDANALHEALGGGPDAVLIGHDWGAMATYGAVAHQPDRWRRAVTAAVPPLAGIGEHFFTYEQLRRSWYTFLFQTPLAELAVPHDGYRFVERLWADWSPGYDGSFDVAEVKAAIGTPERTSAAIGYYRALYDDSGHDPALAAEQAAASQPLDRPTLYLHGQDDGAFGIECIGDPLRHLGEGSRVSVLADAGHFLHLEHPAEVNREIVDFLTR
jgi:pimeloyl-ACP methyl ester carboxylesterase